MPREISYPTDFKHIVHYGDDGNFDLTLNQQPDPSVRPFKTMDVLRSDLFGNTGSFRQPDAVKNLKIISLSFNRRNLNGNEEIRSLEGMSRSERAVNNTNPINGEQMSRSGITDSNKNSIYGKLRSRFELSVNNSDPIYCSNSDNGPELEQTLRSSNTTECDESSSEFVNRTDLAQNSEIESIATSLVVSQEPKITTSFISKNQHGNLSESCSSVEFNHNSESTLSRTLGTNLEQSNKSVQNSDFNRNLHDNTTSSLPTKPLYGRIFKSFDGPNLDQNSERISTRSLVRTNVDKGPFNKSNINQNLWEFPSNALNTSDSHRYNQKSRKHQNLSRSFTSPNSYQSSHEESPTRTLKSNRSGGLLNPINKSQLDQFSEQAGAGSIRDDIEQNSLGSINMINTHQKSVDRTKFRTIETGSSNTFSKSLKDQRSEWKTGPKSYIRTDQSESKLIERPNPERNIQRLLISRSFNRNDFGNPSLPYNVNIGERRFNIANENFDRSDFKMQYVRTASGTMIERPRVSEPINVQHVSHVSHNRLTDNYTISGQKDLMFHLIKMSVLRQPLEN